MKKTLIFLLAFAMVLTSYSEALADRRRSKIRGPFGSWTWGPDIPHIHNYGDAPSKIPQQPPSTNQTPTQQYIRVVLVNIDNSYRLKCGTNIRRILYTVQPNDFEIISYFHKGDTLDCRMYHSEKDLLTGRLVMNVYESEQYNFNKDYKKGIGRYILVTSLTGRKIRGAGDLEE